MPSEPTNKTEWLRQARNILAETYGTQVGRLTIIIKNDADESVTFQLATNGQLNPQRLPDLSPFEADIVRVIGSSALPGKAVASRIGVPYNSTLKTLLSNLIERCVLWNDQSGYRVADAYKSAGTDSGARAP